MPMNPTTLAPIMSGVLSSNGIVGPSSLQMATGLATGLSEYATTGIIVTSVDVGTLGTGIGSGVGVVLDPAIEGVMASMFASNGLVGVFAPALATAIATGFTEAFLQAIVSTDNMGVGVGTGECVMVPNPAVSLQSFLSGFASVGFTGVSIPQLVSAIASGLDQILPTSTATIVIAGSPSIYPGAGSGIGKLS